MPTWHPAALLRDETKKVDFIKDLMLVVEEIKAEQRKWNVFQNIILFACIYNKNIV